MVGEGTRFDRFSKTTSENQEDVGQEDEQQQGQQQQQLRKSHVIPNKGDFVSQETTSPDSTPHSSSK
jgi:hypothetical protein